MIPQAESETFSPPTTHKPILSIKLPPKRESEQILQKPRNKKDGLCPSGATGQFPYPDECNKFVNCWKGRGIVQVCAPGTLFNPINLQCDWPGKVKCLSDGLAAQNLAAFSKLEEEKYEKKKKGMKTKNLNKNIF